jgi:hypothetical protein
MIIFEGKYSWSGKKQSASRPVSWWAGAYRLKIIDLSRGTRKLTPHVLMLKPIVVIVSDTGEGASATNCAPELVKSVCRDFSLDIKKILWIEYHPGPPPYMEAAKFRAITSIHEDILYTVDWRPVRDDELEMIKTDCPEAKNILKNKRLLEGLFP